MPQVNENKTRFEDHDRLRQFMHATLNFTYLFNLLAHGGGNSTTTVKRFPDSSVSSIIQTGWLVWKGIPPPNLAPIPMRG